MKECLAMAQLQETADKVEATLFWIADIGEGQLKRIDTDILVPLEESVKNEINLVKKRGTSRKTGSTIANHVYSSFKKGSTISSSPVATSGDGSSIASASIMEGGPDSESLPGTQVDSASDDDDDDDDDDDADLSSQGLASRLIESKEIEGIIFSGPKRSLKKANSFAHKPKIAEPAVRGPSKLGNEVELPGSTGAEQEEDRSMISSAAVASTGYSFGDGSNGVTVGGPQPGASLDALEGLLGQIRDFRAIIQDILNPVVEKKNNRTSWLQRMTSKRKAQSVESVAVSDRSQRQVAAGQSNRVSQRKMISVRLAEAKAKKKKRSSQKRKTCSVM